MNLPLKLSSERQNGIVIVEEGFLDSGAGGKFIDQNYAKAKGLETEPLIQPIRVYNVDGTPNKRGTIRRYVDLNIEVHGRTRKERLLVTGLGKQKIILGFPWLRETNPIIDWEKGTLEWRKPISDEKSKLGRELPKKEKQNRTTEAIFEEEDEEEHLNSTQNLLDQDESALLVSSFTKEMDHKDNSDNNQRFELLAASITSEMDNNIWINAKINKATEIQAEINQKKEVLPLEEQIPKEFHKFLDVFSEEKAARFPEPRPWDHKIELKDTFTPKSFKTYNLTPEEQIELDKFLKENLEKGYIRPSQSPMASPFFFVNKKDGKLRPCQDYRYLNEHTVKNAYPLPLISELLDKLKGAQRFTKLDV